MATTARPSPYTYVTWVTGLLAGEKQCAFAPWLKSQFKTDRVDRDFDLSAWKAEHAEMVRRRADELQLAGWTVFVEDQNELKLKGESTLLSGKCDIVAIRGDEALVEDEKSGKQRDADFFQVLVYMLALPLLASNSKRPSPMALAVSGKRLSGAVQYHDHRRDVRPEQLTPAVRARIIETLKRMGDSTPPPRVPSAAECRFCDVSSADCPDRIDTEGAIATVADLF